MNLEIVCVMIYVLIFHGFEAYKYSTMNIYNDDIDRIIIHHLLEHIHVFVNVTYTFIFLIESSSNNY
jgi:hypothetical protein